MNILDYLSLVANVEKNEETSTGKSRLDMTVDCRPVLEDPQIIERQSRVICLTKPYAACTYCRHSSFELLFNVNKEQRVEQVSCPRWASGDGRVKGKLPDDYVSVELATCEGLPFEFCPSCPSRKNVATTGADKSSPGWYGRWHRVTKEGEDG
jgi:hypothetical protein